MKILILEDDNNRIKKFKSNLIGINLKYVENANDCINLLKKEKFNFLFLDHDLGGEVYVDSSIENCGMEVVRFLEKNPILIESIFVHSLNEPARKEMVNRLINANYDTQDSMFLNIDWNDLKVNLQNILAIKNDLKINLKNILANTIDSPD